MIPTTTSKSMAHYSGAIATVSKGAILSRLATH